MSKSPRYLSEFRHGVDEKRRVQIPAKWRPDDPEVEFTAFLWPNGEMKDACLLVLPPGRMAALDQKLQGMSFSDPEAKALRRVLGGKSAEVVLDKAGRICLPEFLATPAGITNEAVLVGLFDCFEIWSPERHATAKAADEPLQDKAFKLI